MSIPRNWRIQRCEDNDGLLVDHGALSDINADAGQTLTRYHLNLCEQSSRGLCQATGQRSVCSSAEKILMNEYPMSRERETEEEIQQRAYFLRAKTTDSILSDHLSTEQYDRFCLSTRQQLIKHILLDTHRSATNFWQFLFVYWHWHVHHSQEKQKANYWQIHLETFLVLLVEAVNWL